MSNNNQNNGTKSYLTYGVGFGLLGGAIFAVILMLFIDTPLVWAFTPGIGMLIGLIVGSIMDSNKN